MEDVRTANGGAGGGSRDEVIEDGSINDDDGNEDAIIKLDGRANGGISGDANGSAGIITKKIRMDVRAEF